MASTYTPLGIEKMATGENAGTWGTKTNANLDLIEQVTGGYKSLSIAGGAQTTALTIADGALTGTAQFRMIEFTGTITGNQIVTIPLDIENFYILKNSTSGAYTVQFKYVSGSGSSFTFATTNKKTAIVQATADDGTNPNIIEIQTGGDVVDDTSPQLGGNLDVNGFDIISTSNANVDIVPNGTGDVTLQADTVKVGDSNADATITTNGTGNLTLNTNSGTDSGTITIVDAANGNITITPNGSGNIVLDGLTFPNADGSADTFLKTNGSGTLSFAEVSGGTSWQAVKTSTFTAVAGEGYFINTTGGAIEMDLPAGSIGDEIAFIDYAGTFDTNALTIDQNGTEKIAGSTDPLTVSTERAANTLVYVDGTQGWLLKNN